MRTKYFLGAAIAMLMVAGCTTSSDLFGRKGDWIVLFDGASIEAFRGYKQPDFPAQSWTVEGDALKANPGARRTDLITREKFRDFDLRLEWKVAPGANSGILYRAAETQGAVWSTGPEMQILDDGEHKDGQNPKTSAGSLYALIPASETKQLKPAGQFNTARVVMKNGRVEHWLNGQKVVEYEWNGPQVRKLIAASKFNTMPGFMKEEEGHISLQHHGDAVWFRSIRIRRL